MCVQLEYLPHSSRECILKIRRRSIRRSRRGEEENDEALNNNFNDRKTLYGTSREMAGWISVNIGILIPQSLKVLVLK